MSKTIPSVIETYKSVCKDIGSIFSLKLNKDLDWNKIDLKQKIVAYIHTKYNGEKKNTLISMIDNMESKLRSILDCINTRLFHHTHSTDIDRTDASHLSFITTLCINIAPLYDIYIADLNSWNARQRIAGEGQRTNVVLQDYSHLLDICRRRIKQSFKPDQTEWNYISILETHSPKQISKKRTTKKNKSRTNNSYKLSNDQFSESKNRRKQRSNPDMIDDFL